MRDKCSAKSPEVYQVLEIDFGASLGGENEVSAVQKFLEGQYLTSNHSSSHITGHTADPVGPQSLRKRAKPQLPGCLRPGVSSWAVYL